MEQSMGSWVQAVWGVLSLGRGKGKRQKINE